MPISLRSSRIVVSNSSCHPRGELRKRTKRKRTASLPETRTYLLFRGVGIIEPNDELPFIHRCKVLVQDGRFRVTDVQITARLGWEAGHDLAFDGVRQTERERGGGLGVFHFVGTSFSERGQGGVRGRDRLEVGVPSMEVDVLVPLHDSQSLCIACEKRVSS